MNYYQHNSMKKEIQFLFCICAISCMSVTCKKQVNNNPPPPPVDSSLVNTNHLDYLYTPVTFPDGTDAAGVYIYADAPDYHRTSASGEGYMCVDDVSRAVLVYLRSSKFASDTAIQSKTFKLLSFLVEMQSPNGYFYNFLLTGNQVNTSGPTSINDPEWWSWRALQALTEASPLVKSINPTLGIKMDGAISKLVAAIKNDLVGLPQTTKVVSGITVPQWLPAGSATDQSASLILALIPYCTTTGDAVIKDYIKKLADGIVLMQQGNASSFPYDAFLSWENTWHAYGNDQAYALLKAGAFLNNAQYTASGMAEVDNFYPWLLQNGFKYSFLASNSGTGVQLTSEKNYEQIAYGIRPMVSASAEAFRLTGNNKYADIAGHLSAWFLGANDPGKIMYSNVTGRCYDAITSATDVNVNSGAESTIEALLTMEIVESNAAVKTALNKYKK
jgi:hypothetical protein